MLRSHGLLWTLWALLFLVPAGSSVVAIEPGPKATRWHRALVQRPAPGPLFDRFLQAWLETDSRPNLEAFLTEQANAQEGAAHDLLLAYFHASEGNDLQALTSFQKALHTQPNNARAWLEKAKIEARMLHFEGALADLQQAREAHPSATLAIDIAQLEGQCHVRLGQTEAALACWQALLDQHPEDLTLREDLIDLQAKEGLLEDAITSAKQLIALTKDPYARVRSHLLLSDLYVEADQLDNAVATAREALTQTGMGSWLETEILARFDQWYRHTRDLNGLQALLQELVLRHPQRLDLRQRFATLLAEQGQEDDAMRAYEALLARTPGERSYREAYITLLISLQRHDAAVRQLRGLMKLFPDDPELKIRAASLYHTLGNREEARTSLERALATSDQSAYTFRRVARLMEDYALTDAASIVHDQWINALPDDRSAREAKAAFLLRQKQAAPAMALWRSLAHDATVQELLRISRTLQTFNESVSALDILRKRLPAFAEEPHFLNALCQLAMAAKRPQEALPWALRCVQLAQAENALDAAIDQWLRLAQQAGAKHGQRDALMSMGDRSLNETCLLARLLEDIGNSARAHALLEALAPSTESEKARLLGQRIRLLTKRQDWLSAATLAEAAVTKMDSPRATDVKNLAELYEKAHAWDHALRWTREWKERSPAIAHPWLAEAKVLTALGRPSEAATILRQAALRFPQDEVLQATWARNLAKENQWDEAVRAFWRLFDKATEPSQKLQWIRELASAANHQGTLEAVVQRLASERGNTVHALALAEVYRISGDDEKRRAALRRASQLQPEDASILLELARIEDASGNVDSALATLEEAAKRDPTDRTRRQIAHLQLRKGNEDTGFEILQSLAGGPTMGPREAEALAMTMIGRNHATRAVDFLRPFVESHPNDYRLRYLQAVAHEESGHFTAAVDAFLSALQIRDETLTPLPNSQASAWEAIASEVPPGTLALLRQTETDTFRSYRYRQHAATGSTIALPDNVTNIAKLTLPHLSALRFAISKEAHAHLLQTLTQIGYHYPELVLESASLDRPALDFGDLLREHDNEAMLGYWVLRGMPHDWSSERAIKAFERFEDRYPSLALQVAFYPDALQHAKTRAALFKRACALLGGIDHPTHDLALAVDRALSQHAPWNGNLGYFSDGEESTLTDILMAWYHDSKEPAPVYFTSLALSLREREDLTEFLEVFEIMITRQQGHGKLASSRAKPLDWDRLLSPLSFPPPLTSIPETTIAWVLEASPSPDRLSQYLNQVTDPVLRCLLATHAEGRLQAAITRLLEHQPPTLDAYLLAAAHATEQGDFQKSVTLLEQAILFPMERPLRLRLDGAIVGSVLACQDRDSVLAKGREALVRLRNHAHDGLGRLALEEAMTALDMHEEAQQWARQTDTQTNQALPGTSLPTASTGQIVALINRGHPQRAVRVAAQELTQLAKQFLQPHQLSSSASEAAPIIDPIRAHGLTKSLLTLIDPGPSPGIDRLRTYAAICQLLGQDDRAQERYGSLLDQHPQDDAVRIRLFLLIAQDDPQAAAPLLKALAPRFIDPLGVSIQQLFSDTPTLRKRIALIDALVPFLGALHHEPQPIDTQWVVDLADQFAQSHYEDGVEWAPIHHRYLDQPHELGAERLRAYTALCKVMLDIPQIALEGFRRWGADRLREGASLADLESMALDALLKHRSRPGQAFHHHRDADQVIFPDADFVLLETAYHRGEFAQLRTSCLAELRRQGRESAARSLQAQIDLLTCEDAQFPENAAAFLADAPRQLRLRGNEDHPAVRLISLWNLRQSEADITPLLLAEIEQSLKLGELSLAIVEYALALQERDRPHEVAAWLDACTARFLGPSPQRLAFLTTHYDHGRWQRNTANGRIHLFMDLIEWLGKYESLAFEAANLHTAYHIENLRPHASPLEAFLTSHSNLHPERLTTLFRHSPWLGGLETFRFYRLNTYDRETTFLASLAHALNDTQQTASRAAVDALVQSISPPTFGSQLTLACLADDEKRIAEILGEHSAAILALPPSQREMFGVFVRQQFSEQALLSATEQRSLLKALYNTHPVQGLDLFIERAAAGHFTNHHLADLLRPRFLTLFRSSQKPTETLSQAHRLFQTTIELYEKQLQSHGTPRRPDQSHPAAEMLQTLAGIASHDDLPLALPFILQSLSSSDHAKGISITLHEFAIRDLGTALRHHLQLEAGDFSNVADLHRVLSQLFGDVSFSHLHESLHAILKEAPREWLAQQSTKDAVAMEMLMAIDLYAKAVERRQQAMSYYARKLADRTRPLGWRLALAQRLPLHHLDDSHRLIVGSLLADAWASGAVVLPSQTQTLLAAFMNVSSREDQWTSLMESLAETWRTQDKRWLRAHRLASIHSTDTINQLLSLALTSSSDALLQHLARWHAAALTDDIGTVALLIAHGKPALAASLFEKGWTAMSGDPGRGIRHYTSALEKQLPTFLQHLPTQDLRHYANIILQAFPDAPDKAGSLSQTARLDDLAETLAKTSFRRRDVMERALSVLSRQDHVSAQLLPVFHEILSGLHLAALNRAYHLPQRETKLRLFRDHVRIAAQYGDPTPFLHSLEALSSDEHANGAYAFEETHTALMRAFHAGVIPFLQSGPENAALRPYLPAVRQMGFANQREPDWERYLISLVIHWQTGERAALDHRLASSPAPFQQALAEAMAPENVFPILRPLFPKTASTVDRVRFARDLFPNGNLLEDPVILEPFVSRDELLSDADALIRAFPDGGRTTVLLKKLEETSQNR